MEMNIKKCPACKKGSPRIGLGKIKYKPVLSRYLADLRGTQEIFRFPNGYGASVVKHDGSYGHQSGLFELAVLKYDDPKRENDDGVVCCTTPITNDVIGWLSPADVEKYLSKIKNLPSVY